MRWWVSLGLCAMVAGCRPSEFHYRKMQTGQTGVQTECPSCLGSGKAPAPYDCARCRGTGRWYPETSGWRKPPHPLSFTRWPPYNPPEPEPVGGSGKKEDKEQEP